MVEVIIITISIVGTAVVAGVTWLLHKLGFLKRVVTYISTWSSSLEEERLLKTSLLQPESSSLVLVPGASSRSQIGSGSSIGSHRAESRGKALSDLTVEEIGEYWESKIKELEEEQKAAFEEIQRGKLHPDDRLLAIKKCRLKIVQDLHPDKYPDPAMKLKVHEYFVEMVPLFNRFVQEVESIANAYRISGREEFYAQEEAEHQAFKERQQELEREWKEALRKRQEDLAKWRAEMEEKNAEISEKLDINASKIKELKAAVAHLQEKFNNRPNSPN